MPRDASRFVATLMFIGHVCSTAPRVSAAQHTNTTGADAVISTSVVNLRVSRLGERDALGVRVHI